MHFHGEQIINKFVAEQILKAPIIIIIITDLRCDFLLPPSLARDHGSGGVGGSTGITKHSGREGLIKIKRRMQKSICFLYQQHNTKETPHYKREGVTWVGGRMWRRDFAGTVNNIRQLSVSS